VPYSKEAIAAANEDVKAQVDPAAGVDLQKRYPKAQVRDFDGNPDRLSEMDALIAYLQMLGTLVDVEKAAPQEQGAAPAAPREKAR
jgi:cytochrome c oxidase cbb3-type subunit 2